MELALKFEPKDVQTILEEHIGRSFGDIEEFDVSEFVFVYDEKNKRVDHISLKFKQKGT